MECLFTFYSTTHLRLIQMSDYGEDNTSWGELRSLVRNCRAKLMKRYRDLEGIRLVDLCPLAEQIIIDDPYLRELAYMDSGPSLFGGEIRQDPFYQNRTFDRQFNTLYEVIWMMIYKSVSVLTYTGPYVVQIPNFEIRKENRIRTLHIVGLNNLTSDGELTKSGGMLLLWLADIGELCREGYKYIHYFVDDWPGNYSKMWQKELR